MEMDGEFVGVLSWFGASWLVGVLLWFGVRLTTVLGAGVRSLAAIGASLGVTSLTVWRFPMGGAELGE